MKFSFTNNSNKGFTLIELMISLFVGGFILAGVMFTYLGMKVTTSETMELGELQESGRLAMDILKRDIELSGFWGNYLEDPKNVDIDYTMNLVMQVNKYISANLVFQAIYDDNANPRGFQIREAFGLGFNYAF